MLHVHRYGGPHVGAAAVGMAEQLSGGIGVMADDIVAGLLAALCLWGAGLIFFGF